MADARFYWFPDPSGTMETIDLDDVTPGYPEDRQEWDDVELAQSRRGDGRVFSAYHGGSTMVTISCAAIQTQTVVDDLLAMIGHLRRGGAVGFTLDSAKAWGGRTTSPVYRGSGATSVSGHLWYETAPAISAGGRLVIESPPPEGIREVVIEDTGLTASTRVLTHATQGPRHTFASVCHVRDPDFWPVLFMPADEARRNVLRSVGDRYWDLKMSLLYDVGAALSILQSTAVRQTTSPRVFGSSLAQALELTTAAQTQQDTFGGRSWRP